MEYEECGFCRYSFGYQMLFHYSSEHIFYLLSFICRTVTPCINVTCAVVVLCVFLVLRAQRNPLSILTNMSCLISRDIILHQPDGGSRILVMFSLVYVNEFEGTKGIYFVYMKEVKRSQASNRLNVICSFRSSFVS
jgi:hypothetical protein